jgi:hypothetical protein
VSTRYPPRTWPGLPRPLGATWDGDGVNVAVFSEGATAVELCLLDGPPDGQPDGRLREERLTLEEQSLHVWHGYVPGVSPGQRYGLRVHGDWDPARGRRWNPAKLLVDPYARALCGDATGHPSTRGDSQQDSAAHVPHGVVVHDDFPWGDERPPRTPYAVRRHGPLRAARQGVHRPPPRDPTGPAWDLRRPRAPRRHRTPGVARRDGGGAAAGAPLRERAAPAPARPAQLLGLQLTRLLRPARGVQRERRPG